MDGKYSTMTAHRILMVLLAVHVGCASSRGPRLSSSDSSPTGDEACQLAAELSVNETVTPAEENERFQLTTFQSESPIKTDDLQPTESPIDPEATPLTLNDSADLSRATEISLEDVINSVHRTYPLVQAALQERAIADGNQLSSWGEFDTKLKAASENGQIGRAHV